MDSILLAFFSSSGTLLVGVIILLVSLRVKRIKARKGFNLTLNGAERLLEEDNLEEALSRCKDLAGKISTLREPALYARAKHLEGRCRTKLSWITLGEVNLRLAVEAYEEALNLYTVEEHPSQFAAVQNDLAHAYWTLSEISNPQDNLTGAVEAFERAQEVYAKQEDAAQFVRIQENIERLRKAISRLEEIEMALNKTMTAYNIARKGKEKERGAQHSPDADPGSAAKAPYEFEELTEDDEQEADQKKVDLTVALKEFVEILNKEKTESPPEPPTEQAPEPPVVQPPESSSKQAPELPEEQAPEPLAEQSQEDSVIIVDDHKIDLFEFPEIEDIVEISREGMEIAIEAGTVKEQEEKKEKEPEGEFEIKTEEAATLFKNEEEELVKTILACEESLTIRTIKNNPADYARVLNNLGSACRRLSEIKEKVIEKKINLTRAVKAYNQALGVYSAEEYPLNYSKVQDNLGVTHHILSEIDHKENNLMQAAEAFKLALSFRTARLFPVANATTQENLGAVYLTQAFTLTGIEARKDNLYLAVASFEQALQVYTVQEYPEDRALPVKTRPLRTGRSTKYRISFRIGRSALTKRSALMKTL
jgi:tetratricopeptide (TPR) repeat protein